MLFGNCINDQRLCDKVPPEFSSRQLRALSRSPVPWQERPWLGRCPRAPSPRRACGDGCALTLSLGARALWAVGRRLPDFSPLRPLPGGPVRQLASPRTRAGDRVPKGAAAVPDLAGSRHLGRAPCAGQEGCQRVSGQGTLGKAEPGRGGRGGMFPSRAGARVRDVQQQTGTDGQRLEGIMAE